MNKPEELKKLEQEMLADEDLPLREANLVFGEGDADCKAMFIGEAPGFYEDQLKRPFVGRAGQLLNRLLENIGWPRESVYITNIVKRRPPENRDPLPEEIEMYKPYLTRQIEVIDPVIVVTLGRFSMNYFLPTAKISQDQGRVFKWDKGVGSNGIEREEKGGRYIIPMFHPAAALRSTQVLETLETSFKKLPAILEKCQDMAQNLVPELDKKENNPVSQEALF